MTPTSPLAEATRTDPAGTRPENADLGLEWVEGFAALGPRFFTELRPTPLSSPTPPYWVGHSDQVARELGLPEDWRSDALLEALSGNVPLAGARPLASVY
ncbi:hypothetical protein ACEN8K_37375, partial [Variovorax sp. CT11-76]